MRIAAALLLGWLAVWPCPVRASDFWDEVRSPGLRPFRRALGAAEAALSEGQLQAALELSEAAIARLPEDARGHALRGRALWALQRVDTAAEAFERAIALDPTVLDAAGGDGAAHVAALSGRSALAERIIDRVLPRLQASPRRGALYALRGDLLSGVGPERVREAEASYRQALRDAPELELRAGLGLALCLDRAGEANAAASVLSGIAALDTLEGELWRWPLTKLERSARQALVLDAAGDRSAAQRAWQTVADAAGPWRGHALAKLSRTEAAPRSAR
jgi:tetratricopeptide (TPR) repeat protein